MKRFLILALLSIFITSCSGNLDLVKEITAIEAINHEFLSNREVLKTEVPESYRKNERILQKAENLKIKLKEKKVLSKSELNDFISEFNSKVSLSNFPVAYISLLQKAKDSTQKQYKYLLLLENFIYQEMISELQNSYYRFDAIKPFAFTNKEVYQSGEDVEILIGFMGINTKKPYEIVIGGIGIPVDNIESGPFKITQKAEGKGLRNVSGTINYYSANELVNLPFEVSYEVR